MRKNFLLGFVLLGLSINAYAADPKCAKMESWKKLKGYSYKIVKKEPPPDAEEDDWYLTQTITFCSEEGKVVWTHAYKAESIDLDLKTEDLNGDKNKELIISAGLGGGIMSLEERIFAVSKNRFQLIGFFTTNMFTGALEWSDLDEDGSLEAVFSNMSAINSSYLLPDVYAFDKAGTLKPAQLKKYPDFVDGTLDEIYEYCKEANNIVGCSYAEAVLLLAKSGKDPEQRIELPALASNIKHASLVGWSKDGAEFGYCAPAEANPSASRCEFVSSSTSTTRSLTNESGGALLPSKTKEIKAEAAKKRINNIVSFKIFPDLLPLWKSDKKALEIGAQRFGNEAVYPYSLSIDPTAEGLDEKTIEVHPENISMSPDGTKIGVLAHFTDGAKSVYQVKVFSVGALASEAYDIAGLALYKKELFTFSASLFVQAYRANNEAKWPAYHLACSSARRSDTSLAKEALEIVIEQKNQEVIDKIATEPDFESLRSEEWFKEMTKK